MTPPTASHVSSGDRTHETLTAFVIVELEDDEGRERCRGDDERFGRDDDLRDHDRGNAMRGARSAARAARRTAAMRAARGGSGLDLADPSVRRSGAASPGERASSSRTDTRTGNRRRSRPGARGAAVPCDAPQRLSSKTPMPNRPRATSKRSRERRECRARETLLPASAPRRRGPARPRRSSWSRGHLGGTRRRRRVPTGAATSIAVQRSSEPRASRPGACRMRMTRNARNATQPRTRARREPWIPPNLSARSDRELRRLDTPQSPATERRRQRVDDAHATKRSRRPSRDASQPTTMTPRRTRAPS